MPVLPSGVEGGEEEAVVEGSEEGGRVGGEAAVAEAVAEGRQLEEGVVVEGVVGLRAVGGAGRCRTQLVAMSTPINKPRNSSTTTITTTKATSSKNNTIIWRPGAHVKERD